MGYPNWGLNIVLTNIVSNIVSTIVFNKKNYLKILFEIVLNILLKKKQYFLILFVFKQRFRDFTYHFALKSKAPIRTKFDINKKYGKEKTRNISSCKGAHLLKMLYV